MSSKESVSKNDIAKVVIQLSGLMHATVDLMDPVKSEIDNITLPQGKALFCLLNHYPAGVMLKDIAKEMQVTAGFASPTLESLVKMGLVERSQKESDRRVVEFRPTDKVLKVYGQKEKIAAKLCKKLIVGCDEEDVATFEKVLCLVYQNLVAINQKLQKEKG